MKKQKLTTLFPDLLLNKFNFSGDLDISVSGITYDSRLVEDDFIFCAIKLDKNEDRFWYSINEKEVGDFLFNHEVHIEDAILRGASVIITEKVDKLILDRYPNTIFIYVDHVIKFIGKQVSILSKLLQDNVIAVTGSAGKTTCVKMLESVISDMFPDKHVLRMYKYRLTPVTLPLMYYHFLFSDDGQTKKGRIIVLEMATDMFGCITTLCSIIQPDISIVLNVEDAHINVFGTQQNIAKAKSEIVLGTKDGGVSFLNGNDKYVLGMRDINPGITSLIYGTRDTVYVKNDSFGPSMDYVNLSLYLGYKKFLFRSSFISPSMDTIFSAVFSVVNYLVGSTDDDFLNSLVNSLGKVKPLDGRMSLDIINFRNSEIVLFDNSAKMNSSNLQKLIYQVMKMPFSESFYNVLVLFKFRSDDHKDPEAVFWEDTLSFFDKVIFIDHSSYEDARINFLPNMDNLLDVIGVGQRQKIFLVVAGRSASEASKFISLFKSISYDKN